MKYTDTNKPLVCMQTQSHCYMTTEQMTVKGVLWHSTGKENTELRRYVQPSDTKPAADTYSKAKWLEILGTNLYGNDENHPPYPLSSCNCDNNCIGLNAWIGELADGTVTAVQTMPWDYRPWGCGPGDDGKGSCNSGWIQFEMCEDDLTDKTYFAKIYQEACELTAYLCKMYDINPKGSVEFSGMQVPTILGHRDAGDLGVGSSHSDPYDWFNKNGITMDRVRSDVASLLSGADFTLTPDSSGTAIDPTIPIKPIESVLIRKISLIKESYDSANIRLYTGDAFSKYTWSYIVTNLYTGKPSAEKTLDILSKKTDFTIEGLTPNNHYWLKVIAKDANKNETFVPGFLFSTRRDFPEEVANVNFTMTDEDVLLKRNCKISFSPPTSWGSCAEGITKKGYRTSLIINGHEAGYSDSFFSTNSGSATKSLTLDQLLSDLGVETVNYNDIIQISIIPWIVDRQENRIFTKTSAKSSSPLCLVYPSNINVLHKLFLKLANSFKQISVYNLRD